MALKLSDLIIKDVWNVAGFDIINGRPLFNLKNCNNTELAVTADKVEVTGGRGAPVLAIFSTGVKADLSIESATFDLGLLALQAGDTDGVYGTSVSVPFSEKFVIGSGADITASIKHTPSPDAIVSVILDDGTTLVGGTTATATSFTIASKKITFSADYKGKSGTVFYETVATDAVEIVIDTGSPIQYCTIKAEITVENQCDGLSYMGYIIIPRASIDKNFSISASPNDAAVQNSVFSAVQTCGNTELARIVIYDANELA